MARFRFARGNDAQDNARGRFPRKNAGRRPKRMPGQYAQKCRALTPKTKVAKANDADD
jgi:hypothetical protein